MVTKLFILRYGLREIVKAVTVMDMETRTITITQVVAGNLRAEMARRALNIEDLAEALAVTRHTASTRFNGTKPLTVPELLTIANWLKVSWNTLLTSPADQNLSEVA